jgi:hypothetical protein
VRVPTLTTGIDWGLWGTVVGILGIIAGAVVSIWLYKRGKATKITVEAKFDQSGMVHVLIDKKGAPVVRVREIKLLRPGTNNTLTMKSRFPVEAFNIEAGETAVDCFFQVDPSSVAAGVDVKVWLGKTDTRKASATRMPDNTYIVPPTGVRLTDVRGPDQRQNGSADDKDDKKDDTKVVEKSETHGIRDTGVGHQD